LERSPVGAGGDGQQPKSKSRTTSIPSTYFYTTNQKIISLPFAKMINEFGMIIASGLLEAGESL
jgi:hypothetical protein